MTQLGSALTIGVAPSGVAIGADDRELVLKFDAGEPIRLSATSLRSACKCAHCIRARIDGVFPNSFPDMQISDFAPLGHYAINITFSDGHARGIYPWSYLAELAAA